MSIKNFKDWNNIKIKLENSNKKKFVKKRDVWFIYIGDNIGNEQSGGKGFIRPVVVMKIFPNGTFFGVPLTTKRKEDKYSCEFNFKNKKQWAIVSQFRLFDSKRAKDKVGRISRIIFQEIIIKQGAIMPPGSLVNKDKSKLS